MILCEANFARRRDVNIILTQYSSPLRIHRHDTITKPYRSRQPAHKESTRSKLPPTARAVPSSRVHRLRIPYQEDIILQRDFLSLEVPLGPRLRFPSRGARRARRKYVREETRRTINWRGAKKKEPSPLSVLSGNYSLGPQITYSSNFILSPAFSFSFASPPHGRPPLLRRRRPLRGLILQRGTPPEIILKRRARLKRGTSYAVFSRGHVNTRRKRIAAESPRGRKDSARADEQLFLFTLLAWRCRERGGQTSRDAFKGNVSSPRRGKRVCVSG